MIIEVLYVLDPLQTQGILSQLNGANLFLVLNIVAYRRIQHIHSFIAARDLQHLMHTRDVFLSVHQADVPCAQLEDAVTYLWVRNRHASAVQPESGHSPPKHELSGFFVGYIQQYDLLRDTEIPQQIMETKSLLIVILWERLLIILREEASSRRIRTVTLPTLSYLQICSKSTPSSEWYVMNLYLSDLEPQKHHVRLVPTYVVVPNRKGRFKSWWCNSTYVGKGVQRVMVVYDVSSFTCVTCRKQLGLRL